MNIPIDLTDAMLARFALRAEAAHLVKIALKSRIRRKYSAAGKACLLAARQRGLAYRRIHAAIRERLANP